MIVVDTGTQSINKNMQVTLKLPANIILTVDDRQYRYHLYDRCGQPEMA